MEKEFVKYFKVENFKCFESFEMDNIGQFNLIVGDNNVGKTSLLEALMPHDVLNYFISGFIFFLNNRFSTTLTGDFRFDLAPFYLNKVSDKLSFKIFNSKKDYIDFEFKKLGQLIPTELQILKDKVINADSHAFYLKSSSEDKLIEIKPTTFTYPDKTYFPYVLYQMGYGNDLVTFFSKEINKNIELLNKLIQRMATFITDVSNFTIDIDPVFGSYISVRQKNKTYSIPLSQFGEGANKCFRILCELPMCKDGRLMIDEIDSGIHVSRFKDFWKTILLAAHESKVQIFATTHSDECIKYYLEALQDDDLKHLQSDARCIRLRNTKVKDNGSVKNTTVADVFDFEQFEFAMLNDNDVRG